MNITTTKALNISGVHVWFVQWTTSTRYATTEHARFVYDYEDGPEGADKWLNRPWYEFRYQNAQVDAISGELDRLREIDRRAYLAERGLTKMSAKRREEWQAARKVAKFQGDNPSCYGWWLAALFYAKRTGKYDGIGERERYIIANLDHVEHTDTSSCYVGYKFTSKPDETGAALWFKLDAILNEINC